MQPPLGTLEYLYIGTAAFERDCTYYRSVLGAELVWAFHAFDAKVAAFRLCSGPLFLLADHHPAPSCMPIMEVENLQKTVADLKQRGWLSDGDSFEIPNGPCYRFTDPSGNQMAIFENQRPQRMDQSFADPDNPNALRI